MLLGVYNLPSLVTMSGLLCGFAACWLASSGETEFAVVALIWAGIFDLFDGMVARRCALSDRQAAFGVQIDSIVDMVSFGLAPVMVAMSSGMAGAAGIVIAMVYICAAAQRLAYFNVLQTETIEREGKGLRHYTGLPVTFAALIFPLAFLLKHLIDASTYSLLLPGIFALVSVLFVYPVKIPKPGGAIYVFMLLLAIILTYFWVTFALKGYEL